MNSKAAPKQQVSNSERFNWTISKPLDKVQFMAVNMEAVIELGARSGWGSAGDGADPHASAELDGDWRLAASVGCAWLVERIRQSEKALRFGQVTAAVAWI
jgi:hypothetical protein